MKRSKSTKSFDHLRRLADQLGRIKRGRPPKGKGGSEPVTVEPNRPRLGEGGAAAALEFED